MADTDSTTPGTRTIVDPLETVSLGGGKFVKTTEPVTITIPTAGYMEFNDWALSNNGSKGLLSRLTDGSWAVVSEIQLLTGQSLSLSYKNGVPVLTASE